MKSRFFTFLAQQQDTKSLIVSAGLVSLAPVDWEKECEGLCASDWLNGILVESGLWPGSAAGFLLLSSPVVRLLWARLYQLHNLQLKQTSTLIWPAFKPTHLASPHRGTQEVESELHSELCCEHLVKSRYQTVGIRNTGHHHRNRTHCSDGETCMGRSMPKTQLVKISFFKLFFFFISLSCMKMM